jgi:hypothetical protein
VPAKDIYPQTTPDDHGWPFIRWDGPSSIPLKAACVDGAQVRFMIHAFAKPRYQRIGFDGEGAMIETAEDHCGRIMEAISPIVSGNNFASQGRKFRVRVTSEMLMRDGDEADAYHGILNCVARVLA